MAAPNKVGQGASAYGTSGRSHSKALVRFEALNDLSTNTFTRRSVIQPPGPMAAPRHTGLFEPARRRWPRAYHHQRCVASLRRFAPGGHMSSPAMSLSIRACRRAALAPLMSKKLIRQEIYQLFKAADALVCTETRKNAVSPRDRAMLAPLAKAAHAARGCTSSLSADACSTATYRPSGTAISSKIERASLFRRPTRRIHHPVAGVPGAATHRAGSAQQGSDWRPPHPLRPTFGAEHRAKTGSDTQTAAALGHTGRRHVGWYMRRSRDEREAAIEKMFMRS